MFAGVLLAIGTNRVLVHFKIDEEIVWPIVVFRSMPGTDLCLRALAQFLQLARGIMVTDQPSDGRRLIGRIISAGVIVCAAVAVILVIWQVNAHPRTDDAEVFANYIGMAPLVNGPVTHLYVADNQLVKQGDPLFRY